MGHAGPAVAEAAMLIDPLPPAEAATLRVGTSCRICAAAACPARREPSILAADGAGDGAAPAAGGDGAGGGGGRDGF
jgi:predicted transcriptional regulator